MHPPDRFPRRERGGRGGRGGGFYPLHESGELGTTQRFQHRFEPLRALGMARARVVMPAGGIPDYPCRH